MPTGYTAKVESGETTELRDYILTCARAFGALIMMRDDPMDAPIPKKLEPDTRYYDERIASLTADIAKLSAMSSDDALTESLAANNEARRRHREFEAEDQLRLERHQAMAAMVEKWRPPTRDHVELKSFMLQQLEVSSRHLGGHRELPDMPIGEEWRQKRLSDLKWQLENARENRDKEIERTAGRQAWIDALFASLPEQVSA
jgi:hypothetical protein